MDHSTFYMCPFLAEDLAKLDLCVTQKVCKGPVIDYGEGRGVGATNGKIAGLKLFAPPPHPTPTLKTD